jgi:hypothetical protein
MNAIPLINNAPRPNINVGSIGSPAFNPVAAGAKLGGSIGGNVMRQNPASMPENNETQLRQEINTSLVALKKEAGTLENLIAQAAQTLQDINKRLSELEGKQGDYVKKADATVESVGGNGKYISAISETDGKISATATDLGNMVPVNSVTSGNMHSVTSNAVATYIQRTSYGFKIGNLMIETISINVGELTFSNGRASISNPYTFSAPFTSKPNVILCSQNDADYGYCTVLGIVRTTTKISTLGLYRNNDGTFNNIFIKGIAIGI